MVELLSRGRGAVLRCSMSKCRWRVCTGQATKRGIRAYGKTIGWRRSKASGRMGDPCPEHAEQATRASRERRAERERRRKLTPEQRRAEDRQRRQERRAVAFAEERE